VRESSQDAGVGGDGAARPTLPGLFVVERRLPKINDHQLTVLQATLTSAATRFSTRGDGVRLVGSIFLARQERLLSLCTAESMEAVRAVNEARQRKGGQDQAGAASGGRDVPRLPGRRLAGPARLDR